MSDEVVSESSNLIVLSEKQENQLGQLKKAIDNLQGFIKTCNSTSVPISKDNFEVYFKEINGSFDSFEVSRKEITSYWKNLETFILSCNKLNTALCTSGAIVFLDTAGLSRQYSQFKSAGIALLLVPRGLPGRCFGLLWLCPIIFYQAPAPKRGEIRFTLLDVGQGLAAVVQTAKHSLVFDAGPPMGEFDDAGQRVILPFLCSSGIRQIDQLMISHGDSDHAGGVKSLLQNISVAQILTSVPERFPKPLAQLCRAGQHWQWDGVDFQVLYPSAELLHQNNNSSCVLRVQSGKTVVLLTGDIEKSAEEFLVQTNAPLAADILVAPHHGSKTSSTTDFVRRVHPSYVLFAVGYKNRYHFPSQMVVKRYEKLNSILLNTADSGAITVNVNAESKVDVKQYRQENRRIWY